MQTSPVTNFGMLGYFFCWHGIREGCARGYPHAVMMFEALSGIGGFTAPYTSFAKSGSSGQDHMMRRDDSNLLLHN